MESFVGGRAAGRGQEPADDGALVAVLVSEEAPQLGVIDAAVHVRDRNNVANLIVLALDKKSLH